MKKNRRTPIPKFCKTFILFISLLLSGYSVNAAQINDEKSNTGLNIDKITVEELQKLYQESNYPNDIPRDGLKVPAIFLKNFPTDFDKITDDNLRTLLFIKILSPIAIKINQEILSERQKLNKIVESFDNNGELTPAQTTWIENLAKKYDLFTRLKGQRRYKRLLTELLLRVDVVPPSVLIAVSAIETDWGKSRIVKDGRSLYKEYVWYSQEGLVPEDEPEDKNYKIRIFPSLTESMRSFALKLNSGVNFEQMRNSRKETRYRLKLIDGRSLAATFYLLSPRTNYIGLLDYTITFYELINVDDAPLDYSFLSKNN